jgi:hypothetical protein
VGRRFFVATSEKVRVLITGDVYFCQIRTLPYKMLRITIKGIKAGPTSHMARGWQWQCRSSRIPYEARLLARKINQHGGVDLQQFEPAELSRDIKLRRPLSRPQSENTARVLCRTMPYSGHGK